MSNGGDLLHLDCPSGLAGDMFLGACLDLGMPLELLEQMVAALGLEGVGVEARKARRGGLEGTRFRVLIGGAPLEGPDPEEAPRSDPAPVTAPARDLPSIRALLRRSGLDVPIRERAEDLFLRLGEVEARAHGVALEQVHFHEVGAIDSIVDITGACVALDYLRPARLTCGVVTIGSGQVETEHGVLPVPAPATAELLHGVPTRGGGDGELLTPTGALILTQVSEFGPRPPMVTTAHGYGLGKRELAGQANAARLTHGRSLSQQAASVVTVIESQVDDLSGEAVGHAVEALLAGGALDVFVTPVQMKKNRPGVLITVLCREARRDQLARRLMRETGSLGCRYYQTERLEAERHERAVETPFGPVRVKLGELDGERYVSAPEYEDCRRLARERDVPFGEVYRAALAAADRLG